MCQAFELDRGMVSQAGMNAFLVVEALDVGGNRGVECGVAGKGPLMREFGLERVKEAAIARPVHAGHDERFRTRCQATVDGYNPPDLRYWTILFACSTIIPRDVPIAVGFFDSTKNSPTTA